MDTPNFKGGPHPMSTTSVGITTRYGPGRSRDGEGLLDPVLERAGRRVDPPPAGAASADPRRGRGSAPGTHGRAAAVRRRVAARPAPGGWAGYRPHSRRRGRRRTGGRPPSRPRPSSCGRCVLPVRNRCTARSLPNGSGTGGARPVGSSRTSGLLFATTVNDIDVVRPWLDVTKFRLSHPEQSRERPADFRRVWAVSPRSHAPGHSGHGSVRAAD